MASLDMSLDDMIKSRRTTDKGNRGRGRGFARGGGLGQGRSFGGGRGRPTGPPRRGPLAVNARSSAFSIAKSYRRPKSLPWQRDLLEESLKAAGVTGFDNGATLNVSNLDTGVTNEDIRELFSEIGELKRYAIHYDKYGRPSGSAEVLFARRSDAFQALKRYNNVQLDGKPMKIEIESSNPKIHVSARVNVGGLNGQRTVVMMSGVGRGRGGAAASSRGFVQRNRGGIIRNGRGGSMTNMRGGGTGRGRGRGRGQSVGRGRGRGRGRKPAVDKSADELDKELENYHSMQT